MNRPADFMGPLADPRQGAVVVVDIQNDFVAPAGKSPGRDTYRAMTERRLAPFVDSARTLGVTIVWVRMENALDSLTPANLRMKGGWFGIDPESPGGPLAILERSVCQRGSWGADLYLPVQPGDLVIPKTRYSSFIGTTLADDLRMRDLQTLAVCGVVTNQCVESTVRDAYQLDFDVVLVDDCCAAGSVDAHNATLANVRSSFGRVLDSGALLTAWREFSSVS